MKTCLVSLVSDQTIPNIIIAAHFQPDFMMLVSTAGMEKKGKSRAIIETLKLRGLDYSGNHKILEVSEDSIIDFQDKVAQWLSKRSEEFLFTVNLTGGTKLMSIAAFDLFTDFGSEMVYVPIPKNEYLKPFPKRRPKHPTSLPERLSVAEYLCAYGFKITNSGQLDKHKSLAVSRREVTQYLFTHYREIRPLLKWVRALIKPVKKNLLKRGCELSGEFECENECQAQVLGMLGFERRGSQFGKRILEADWEYLRGGWLEEMLFLSAKAALPSDTDIQLGVQCEDPKGNRNEFDVLLTHENVLYLIESKSLDASEGGGELIGGTINDFLYKLGALRQSFGLTPMAYLATTSEEIAGSDGRVKPHLVERGKQFRTRIIPLLEIGDVETYFVEHFPE